MRRGLRRSASRPSSLQRVILYSDSTKTSSRTRTNEEEKEKRKTRRPRESEASYIASTDRWFFKIIFISCIAFSPLSVALGFALVFPSGVSKNRHRVIHQFGSSNQNKDCEEAFRISGHFVNFCWATIGRNKSRHKRVKHNFVSLIGKYDIARNLSLEYFSWYF